MAKSIRSKWRRKCRAIKRIRYGEKELERLKKTLANDPLRLKTEITDILPDVEEVATIKTSAEIEASSTSKDQIMDIDTATEFNPRTLRNKDGAYPVWVHPRKIRGNKKKNRKNKNKKKVKRNK